MSCSQIAKSFTVALCLSGSLFLQSPQAAILGNVKSGKSYAQTHCAACHSVLQGSKASPVDAATPFQVIANTPGINRRAMIVFLRSPHPTMPNIVVRGDDADNLITYILSLKSE